MTGEHSGTEVANMSTTSGSFLEEELVKESIAVAVEYSLWRRGSHAQKGKKIIANQTDQTNQTNQTRQTGRPRLSYYQVRAVYDGLC